MESNRISLSGFWELSWQNIGKGTEKAFSGQVIQCPVPGDIHMALSDAGVISEPSEGLNSLDCRWLETQEFWYRKRFSMKEDFFRDVTELTFHGLDTTADIWLNGVYLGSSNNAFVEKTLDVTGILRPGENLLTVRIDEGVEAVRHKDLELTRHAWNREQPYRAWMRKPQYVYGWDWTVWLPSCGIWKDVTLESYRRAILRDVYVRNTLSAKAAELQMDVQADFLAPGAYILRCEIYEDPRFGTGELVTAAETAVGMENGGSGVLSLSAKLRNPRLWWPRGYGEPYLYTLVCSVTDENGDVLCSHAQRHGIRTVELRQEPLEPDASGFTFMINGEPIFCKGANHVPADCFPGRITREKNRALLEAAAQANMNMIRVWGGGIYESDDFMACCDELGLMVWHDFMFACMYYPDYDPEFMEELRRETTAAIRRLRKFSCLVGWIGNNEVQEMYHALRQWNPEHPWYGGKIYEQLLPEQVRTLCPDRIYRESSPFGGPVPDSYDQGDQHTWHFTHRPNWEHYLDLWRFTDFDFKFLSEFGIIGAMNLESARKCISSEALQPGSREWRHHTNSSMDHTLLDVFVDTYFGLSSVRSVQDYILKSQAVQAEIMRHIYDELRSRKFRCSGVLLWTLSDSYGIHNWSVIDYYLGKRPVYYYLKRAMAPVNVAFRGYDVQCFNGMQGYQAYFAGSPAPVELVGSNDTRQDKSITVQYRILTFRGELLRSGSLDCVLPANVSRSLGFVELPTDLIPEETLLYVRVLEGSNAVNENHYFFAPYGKLRLEAPHISRTLENRGEETRLTFLSDTFVWLLHLCDREGTEYSDNDFILLPGVPRTVILTGADRRMPAYVCLNPQEKEKCHDVQ